MKNYEKIIKLIKEDKEIAENLLYFQEFREDVSLWTDPPRDGINYDNMNWLFVTDQENFSLIGVNLIDETIWCIDDEGDFHQDCDALENLPYEIQLTGHKDVSSLDTYLHLAKSELANMSEILKKLETQRNDDTKEAQERYLFNELKVGSISAEDYVT